MENKKNYKRVTWIGAFLLGLSLAASAQTGPSGSFSNPVSDPSLTVYNVDEVHLSVKVQQQDSVVWKYQFFPNNTPLVLFKDTILAFYDIVNGQVLVKHAGIWTYNTFDFNGIKFVNDTLKVPASPTAVYTWFKDGMVISSNFLNYLNDPKPGRYSVQVGGYSYTFPNSSPAYPFDSLWYSYTVIGDGSTTNLAISDPSILQSTLNNFSLANTQSVDSVIWIYNNNTFASKNQSAFFATEDGSGQLFILQNGQWKSTSFSFTGIHAFPYGIQANVYGSPSYQWYFDNVLVPDSVFNTMGNLQDGVYTVKANWNNIALGGTVFNNLQGTYSYTFSGYKLGSAKNPYVAKDLISQNGLSFSVSTHYSPVNSISWSFYNFDNLGTGYTTLPTVTVSGPTILTLTAQIDSNWYTQSDTIQGITYNVADNAQLSAPVVTNATYAWYYNDQLLPNITTSSFVPQNIGTYKVVIVWASVNQRLENARLDGAINDTAVFVFNVTKLPLLTGLEGNINAAKGDVSVYPNPASQYVQLASTGSFEYKLEDLRGTTLLSGSANDVAELNLGNMKAGVYLVYIKTNGTKTVNRLVVY